MRVKVQILENTYALTVSEDITYTELLALVASKVEGNRGIASVLYIDEENEAITVSSQQDWLQCISVFKQLSRAVKLVLKLHPTSTVTPTPQTPPPTLSAAFNWFRGPIIGKGGLYFKKILI